jgi:hypothetical protein
MKFHPLKVPLRAGFTEGGGGAGKKMKKLSNSLKMKNSMSEFILEDKKF